MEFFLSLVKMESAMYNALLGVSSASRQLTDICYTRFRIIPNCRKKERKSLEKIESLSMMRYFGRASTKSKVLRICRIIQVGLKYLTKNKNLKESKYGY